MVASRTSVPGQPDYAGEVGGGLGPAGGGSSVGTNQTEAPPTDSAGSSGESLVARGMFKERPSSAETPTVYITNEDNDLMTVVFRSADGRTYQLQATAGMPGSVQLPAGEYEVFITSNSPMISDNSGTAVFRRHREYYASFYTVRGDAPPVRMGDQ